jgi:hypothetical protein
MSRWNPFAKSLRPDVLPGRQSEPEDTINGVISSLASFYSFSSAPFDLRALEVLELLGMFNPDVSQVLSIWVNLGNTGHELEVEARNTQAVLDRLNRLAATVYQTGGGIDGMVNHFLRQIPLMGALSAEWVVADRIQDGLIDCVVVPVKKIRWRRVAGDWIPFQLTSSFGGGNMGYVALNPLSYSYMPLQTNDGNPYAIPLFLSALKNLGVQLDAVGNIGAIMRKMGLVGFVDVALEVPDRKGGESDESFTQRCTTRLKQYASSYVSGLSRGVAVHYKDQEIKHNAMSPGAAAGAKSIFDMNEEQIFSALDMPPSMCGRSYSTTETYAEQDFEKVVAKLNNGRRIVKRFLEKGYGLDLLLAGIDAQVSLNFHENSAFKRKEKEEAEGEKIKNVLAKRDGGIIDDNEAARELGYEKATGKQRGEVPPLFSAAGGSQPTLRFGFNRTLQRYEFVPERIVVLETPSDDRHDQSYQAALESVLIGPEEAAIEAAMAAGEQYLQSAKIKASSQVVARQFAAAVWEAFATTLRQEAGLSAVMRVCTRFTSDEWQRWRYEDKNHLSSWRRGSDGSVGSDRLTVRRSLAGIDIGLVDKNALKYITNVEQFYFGRGNYLAQDDVTGTQFISWLQEEYIAKGLNIRDDATWTEFKGLFKKLVEETSYQKIEQIVSTTMGRIQNMGQTLSLYEADVKTYQIVGPSTPPICKHCLAMLGRKFSVKVAAERLANILDKGFEKPEDLPPFLSSQYRAEQVKEMSDEELQAAGFETPPFHPKCRHRKAAAD